MVKLPKRYLSVNGFIIEEDLQTIKLPGENHHQKIYGCDGWTSPPSTQGYLTLSTLKGFEMIDKKMIIFMH